MPKTLLLADDSVVIQKLVALSFANEDVELITTDNGDDAVTRAKEVQPDLVLADVVMPGKNGYEVCEAIRQDPTIGGIPVVLLTGTFEAFDADRAQQVESDGHITKPFEAQALVDRVNELLARGNRAPAASATQAPAAPTPPVAETTPEYDFFDEGSASGSPELDLAPPEAAPQADSFAFGEADIGLDAGPAAGGLPPLESPAPASAPAADPLDAANLPPIDAGDRTVAFMPDSDGDFGDALMPDAPIADVAAPSEAHNALSGPTDPVVIDTGLIADDPLANVDFGGVTDTPELEVDAPELDPLAMPPSTPEPMPVSDLGDHATPSQVSFGTQTPPTPPAGDPAETILADDLFSAPGGAAADAAASPGDSFSLGPDEGFAFDMGSPSTAQAAPAADPLMETGELLGTTTGDLPREGSADWDVSSSDLGDSFAAGVSASDSPAETIVDAEAFSATPAHGAPEPIEIPSLGSPEPAISDRDDSRKPDLSPMMRERIHETLEKVAWEAFADVSDTIVREVLKRVESVAWEVIPQMAEAMIQEEIRRMKDETD